MVETKRWNNVEFPNANQILEKDRLIVGRAILIQGGPDIDPVTNGICLGAARRVEKVRSEVGVDHANPGVLEGITLERRVAPINDAAEGQSATAEHAVIPPAFPKTQIKAAIVELLITEGRGHRKHRRIYEPRTRGICEIVRRAGVDLLVRKPTLGLHEPAVAKLQFVTQYRGVAINPIFVVRGGREILVRVELELIHLARIAAVEAAGVELQRNQLVAVRMVTEITVGLPDVVIAIVTLTIRSSDNHHRSGIPTGRSPAAPRRNPE